jgi:anti-sigma factor RsiW
VSWLGDPHLGTHAAELVDGELGHDARDRALAHLAWCADCRREVGAQRRLKRRLGELRQPAAPDALLARLRANAERREPAPARGERRRRPPSTYPRSVRRARRAVAAGTCLAAAVGVAFAIGDSHQAPKVSPSVGRYVDQHAVTSDEMPLGRPAGGAAATVSYTRTTAP